MLFIFISMFTISKYYRNFSCDLQNNIVKPIKAFSEQQYKSRKPVSQDTLLYKF